MGLFKIELRQTFECSVCKQLYDEQRMLSTNQIVKVFGAKNGYVQCCCCGLDVVDFGDPAYRRRWERWAHKLVRERIKTLRQILKDRRDLGTNTVRGIL